VRSHCTDVSSIFTRDKRASVLPIDSHLPDQRSFGAQRIRRFWTNGWPPGSDCDPSDMGNGWVGCDDGIGHAVERVLGKGGSLELLSALRQEKSAELLLNYRLQMRTSGRNGAAPNANKTRENRSVRIGQVGLANRSTQPLCHLSAVCIQQLSTDSEIPWCVFGAL
jgi:hypothetical protein